MAEQTSFWKDWSPYWSFMEDNFLDSDAVDSLVSGIGDPVLVIGAGQGLVVAKLRQGGLDADGLELEPEMIAYARSRRALDLIHANAKSMPIPDNRYMTSIIATGVIDFLQDEAEIGEIVNEALRVTQEPGRVLAIFYGFPRRVERFLRRIGVLTENEMFRIRKLHELLKLACDDRMRFIGTIKSEAGVGLPTALLMTLRAFALAPKSERRKSKQVAAMWKQAASDLPNPNALIDNVPDAVPFRDEQRIRALFDRIAVPVRDVTRRESCIIVGL